MVPTISLAVSEYGVARGAGGIVGGDKFDVEAEVGPSFVGVVGLAVTMVEYGVWCEHGGTECEHDVVLDRRVGWAMVHGFIVGME